MKKFIAVFLLFICALFPALCFADNSIDRYDASNYTSWGKLQCLEFVNKFLKYYNIITENLTYDTSMRTLTNAGVVPVGQILYNDFKAKNGRYPTVNEVKAEFEKAQPGDVVQMYWDTYGTPDKKDDDLQHTVIISKAGYGDGIQFLHSNYPYGSGVSNTGSSDKERKNQHYWSYETLARCYQYAGDAGGFSIYRLGSTQPTAPTISTPALKIGREDVPYLCELEATWFGTTPKWTATGLPPELKLNFYLSGSDFHMNITGTPTQDGEFDVTISGANEFGTNSTTLKLIIEDSDLEMPTADVDEEYPYDIKISKNWGDSLTAWTLEEGSMPEGLNYKWNSKGYYISFPGKPKQSGSFHFTLKATNSGGTVGIARCHLTVRPEEKPQEKPLPPDGRLPLTTEYIESQSFIDLLKHLLPFLFQTKQQNPMLLRSSPRLSASSNTEDDVIALTPEQIAQIKELDLSDLNISSLVGINYFTSLEKLYCYGNELTTLNVTGCKNLRELDCSRNKLENLNVSGCSSLNDLNFDAENLVSLNISGTALKELDVAVSGARIQYRWWGKLATLTAKDCKKLETLLCARNVLTTLNVSGCTALKVLDCGDNLNLSVLDIKGCSSLKTLSCSNNSLSILDLSGHTALVSLDCVCTGLRSLNVSNCTSLKDLKLHSGSWSENEETELVSFNASGCTALEELSFVSANDLSSLNLTGCTALKTLAIEAETLSALDVRPLTALKKLYIYSDNLSALDVRPLTTLEELHMYGSSFTELDVSGHKALKKLGVSTENLRTLNASGCTSLETLICSSVGLETVNVSGCSALVELDCNESGVNSLNTGDCSSLQRLQCEKNNLSILDLRDCAALEELRCRENHLTALYLSEGAPVSIFCDEGVLPKIATQSLPTGTVIVGQSYSFQLTTSGGVASPLRWGDASNYLKVHGLTLDPASGVISGTVVKPEGYNYSSYTIPIHLGVGDNICDKKNFQLTVKYADDTDEPVEPKPDPVKPDVKPDTPSPVTPDKETDNIDTGSQEKILKQLESPSAVKDAMERRGLGTPNTLQKSNSNVGAERNASSLRDEEKKVVSDDNATVAAVLPEMSVNVSGTYLLGVDIDANVPTGAALALYLFPRTAANGGVALSGETAGTFYDDEGNETTTVPENHHVNVAAELTAGITYAPVITAVTSSTPDSGNDANENGTSGSGGGGGCNTGLGLAGIAALGLAVLAAKKRR